MFRSPVLSARQILSAARKKPTIVKNAAFPQSSLTEADFFMRKILVHEATRRSDRINSIVFFFFARLLFL